jgi:hypothetical protein
MTWPRMQSARRHGAVFVVARADGSGDTTSRFCAPINYFSWAIRGGVRIVVVATAFPVPSSDTLPHMY